MKQLNSNVMQGLTNWGMSKNKNNSETEDCCQHERGDQVLESKAAAASQICPVGCTSACCEGKSTKIVGEYLGSGAKTPEFWRIS